MRQYIIFAGIFLVVFTFVMIIILLMLKHNQAQQLQINQNNKVNTVQISYVNDTKGQVVRTSFLGSTGVQQEYILQFKIVNNSGNKFTLSGQDFLMEDTGGEIYTPILGTNIYGNYQDTLTVHSYSTYQVDWDYLVNSGDKTLLYKGSNQISSTSYAINL